MDKSMEELLRGPDQLQSIYIHRKNKDFIIAKAIRDVQTDEIHFECQYSEDGFNGVPVESGPAVADEIPSPSNNIYQSMVLLGKYLNKNGFKEVNTIVQTKDGVKLK